MHVADRYLEAWNHHDAEAIRQCFHPDGIYIDANLDDEISASQFALRAQELFSSFPRLQVSIDHRSALDEHVVTTKWRLSGALPNKVLSGMDMLCIRDNKLQSVQVYFDLTTGLLFAKVPSLHLKYQQPLKNNHQTANKQAISRKYSTSGLSPTEMKDLQTKLEAAMTRHKLFLQHDLSLSSLADHLATSTNHLSQLVNSHYACNFYDFINHHRIRYTKALIANEQQKQSSLALYLESGFRSSSTFYAAFKKETGLTPSAYRAKQAHKSANAL